MFNPYFIILSLFVVAGILVTLWGLRVIVMARKTLQWPGVEGTIEESRVSSDADDMLPHIRFCYRVQQQDFRQLVAFPGDITPGEEFSRHYVEKYPEGSRVQVYYNPDKPDIATLEPGVGKGDWLIFAIGLATLLLGVFSLIFSG